MSERIIGKIIRNSFVNGKIEGSQRVNGRVCIVPPVEEIITKFKSMAYFFSNNYNNKYYGVLNTSGALICDYIFKNNSMTDIAVDLSNCYSAVGGFMGSSVENVTFEKGTPKLQKANNLFRGCTKMVSVTSLDLTNCDSVKYMFMDCESLTQSLTIKTKATDLSYMFYNCKKIATITLDTPNLKIAKGIFTGCESLNKIIINTPLEYSALFNELPTVKNKEIELVNQNLGVSADVEKIATSKGWSIKYVSTVNKDFATIY